MDVTMNWAGGMAFDGVGPSGFVQHLDSDVNSGGQNSGVRPMELIAMGLAGCTGMDVISILNKKKQIVTGFQVNVHAERAGDHPKVFTQSVIEYVVHGTNIDENAVRRAIELSVEKYCPAHAMLSKAFPIRLVYKVFEAATTELACEGEFIHKKTGE